MDNSTPSAALSDEQARAAAEAALREKGWLPRQWDGLAGALDGGAPGGSYSIRMYAADGPDAPREALCQIDDRTRRDHSGDVSPYLWMVGIPRPEEVPALFEGHPEATGWGEDGAIWDHILDLATGEVIPEKRAQELLKDPVLEMIREAKKSITERAGVLRDLVAAGWDPDHVDVSLHGDGIMRNITAWGRLTKRGHFGEQLCLVLRVRLWRGGVMEISAEDPGHGIEVPIVHPATNTDPAIPTPDEAAEAYYERLRQGRVVHHEVPVYEEQRDG